MGFNTSGSKMPLSYLLVSEMFVIFMPGDDKNAPRPPFGEDWKEETEDRETDNEYFVEDEGLDEEIPNEI